MCVDLVFLGRIFMCGLRGVELCVLIKGGFGKRGNFKFTIFNFILL